MGRSRRISINISKIFKNLSLKEGEVSNSTGKLPTTVENILSSFSV